MGLLYIVIYFYIQTNPIRGSRNKKRRKNRICLYNFSFYIIIYMAKIVKLNKKNKSV